MKRRIDLEELVGLVNLPDRLFQWSLEIATGEVYPGPDDSAQLVPLPQLTETQIFDQKRRAILLNWIKSLGIDSTAEFD